MSHKTRALLALSLSAFLAACSTTGGSASTQESDVPADAIASTEGAGPQPLDPDRRVCEKILPTGTRIAQRVCMKQSEWDRIRENAKQATINHQQRATQQGNPSGN